MMSDFGQRDAPPSAGESGPGASPPPRVFLGQPHIGRFVATRVDQAPGRRESHVAGLFIVPYRVTLEVKEALPAVKQKSFVMHGSRGEGPEAGALGLQDWLPTKVGDECVLAFDPQLIENAEWVVFLGGANVERVWQSAKRFYESLRSGRVVDPAQVALGIRRPPAPGSTFFQLLFSYDRSAYRNATVMRALGEYLVDKTVPVLDRRTTVAHYLGQPNEQDSEALRELSSGMLQLALDLAASGQASSAGVVLQRLYGYCFDPTTASVRVKPPSLNAQKRLALEQLLDSPELSLNAEIARNLRTWLEQ